MTDPSPMPSATPPALKPQVGGGCFSLGLAILIGCITLSSVLSLPLVFWMPTTSFGGRVAVFVTTLIWVGFCGYACRGAFRAYRGLPNAHLIPPNLLRPVAFVVGLGFTLAGLGGVVSAERGAGRVLGFGVPLVIFALAPRRNREPESARDGRPN